MKTIEIKPFEDTIQSMDLVPVSSFGNSLVVAPHPDDETLGCGGTAALLIQSGYKVNFLFMSDGTMSHPNSKKYPRSVLRSLRESEAQKAVKTLGGADLDSYFFALPDRSVPDTGSPFFEAAVRMASKLITEVIPKTIFIPWYNDPHPDHKATFQIITTAVSRLEDPPRVLQYPIWLWELGNEEDILLIRKLKTFCVDIRNVMDIKMKALEAHQSQITDLIDDDPDGFTLSQEIIAHFAINREVFFEKK